MRILILAEDCNPEWSSVPAFAYHSAIAIARYAEVTLATQVRNWGSLKRAGVGGAKLALIDTERIADPLWKIGLRLRGGSEMGWHLNNLLSYPSHIAFEVQVARHFHQELRRGDFDVVHRLSPCSGVTPSYLASNSPLPFLLGPVNDNLPWPEVSTDVRDREISGLDRFIMRLLPLRRRLPYQRSKYHHASAILASYRHTIAGLPRAVRHKTISFPDIGFDPTIFGAVERPTQPRKTILFVGRLVPVKAPEVVVKAFAASAALRRHRLIIVGAGPERPRLEELIARHDLAASVELVGWKSSQEVGQLMRRADVLALPSIREMGGGVIVEAMAAGMVPLVVDYGGPAALVRPEFGVKVAVGAIPDLVERFRTELEQLLADDARLLQLGQAAHHHAMTYYTWDAKARKTVEIYRWLLGQIPTKPDFWDQPGQDSGAICAG